MPQYFIEPDKLRAGLFSAGEDESRHIARVARKRAGDEIEIFDGKGRRFQAVIEKCGELVSGRIKAALPSPAFKTRLVLCFAPVSRPAAESIIEHCTEAGAAAFQPVITSRTQFDWLESWPEKSRRFQQLLTAACKQCGRASFPELLKPRKLDDLLKEFVPAVIASMETDRTFSAIAPEYKGAPEVRAFIGPEGGFTKDELEYAAKKGAKSFSLGKHILRAETAALAAAVLIFDSLG
jgi:16S rRNA (uracil1498-N3)-methyltransferase